MIDSRSLCKTHIKGLYSFSDSRYVYLFRVTRQPVDVAKEFVHFSYYMVVNVPLYLGINLKAKNKFLSDLHRDIHGYYQYRDCALPFVRCFSWSSLEDFDRSEYLDITTTHSASELCAMFPQYCVTKQSSYLRYLLKLFAGEDRVLIEKELFRRNLLGADF